ncbi:AAA family ATPase [Mucilaginibacter sp. KACC 22773]|uniref:AAA family ATPase n=1 Tax=Mucilaginibacter sp. KACC 22773 TaxID=3025671 RepID=UPI0023656831|nr:AAA family ATPase [Mucilaginibacter sp. KACC 22773]WDF77021.1 AAA family ATPase [Mucilaginibacter sp. KACC 22773]
MPSKTAKPNFDMNSLLYLYLEDYDNFLPFELNLTNEFDIKFDGEKIHISKRRNYLKEILGENIYDINVIAGENGIGKTTLLKTITEILMPTDGEDDYYINNYKYLMVYQLDFETVFIIHSLRESNVQPEVGAGMEKIRIEHSAFENYDLDRPMIYYSPFLDFNVIDFFAKDGKPQIFDISLTQIVMEDLDKNGGYMDSNHDFLFHKTKNSKRQINFINETKGEFDLPFELPKTLNIHFNRLNPNKEDISARGYSLFDKLTADCATQLREHSEDQSKKKVIAKILFLRNLLSMYFLSINGIKTPGVLHHNYSDDLAKEIIEFKSKYANKLIKLIEKFFANDDLFKSSIFPQLIAIVYRLLSSRKTGIYFTDSNHLLVLEVSVDDPAITELFKVLNYVAPKEGVERNIVPNLHKFISFDWRNFSSGEKMFLDLFSRMHVVKSSLTEKHRPLLIFIDEGEIGLHPSWQIKYISFLCKFLNAIFKEYKIQLIIATHSPLVLSDFPKERVHLFKKTEDGNRRYKEESFGTFAQNTSVLLANDFFIESSLIGDLAKQYINDILNDIENIENAVQIFTGNLMERILLIDEPIIKQLMIKKLREIRYA